jgi:hypothetical protein
MRDAAQGPRLGFPSIPVGDMETPLSLDRLLYKTGATLSVDRAAQALDRNELGSVLPERMRLVQSVHEFIDDALVGGGSASTARTQIKAFVVFFSWAESEGATLSMSEVQTAYLGWAEHLWHRVRVAKDLLQSSAYDLARIVGQIIDAVLERATPIIELTRIRRPPPRTTPQGAQADKQQLTDTFAFGRLLQAICDGLPVKVIRGHWDVVIELPDGGEWQLNAGRRPRSTERQAHNVRASEMAEAEYLRDSSIAHPFRVRLVNLRIHAELLMFIGQTGMNLAQVQALRMQRFSYTSHIDGYTVREYKGRRHGEVLFEIFSAYRSHFERYLTWRREFFPESKELFPLIRLSGVRQDRRPSFWCIQAGCKVAGVPWTAPSELRCTRVNWMLRRSGDPDLTADIAQHSTKTLLHVYDKPSQQRALPEIARFWVEHDPALKGARPLVPAAPGACIGTPVPVPSKPKDAPDPDCVHRSGCLWCDHHRDVDTQDYVWSLACFRHLKVLEKSGLRPPTAKLDAVDPADHAIKRISDKLEWFRRANATRESWFDEALARVEEGDYHPDWDYLIEPLEGASS